MKNIEALASVLVIVGAVALPVACGSPTNGTCEETSSCASGMPDGGEGEGEGGADVVQPPAGCDPGADVKDAPKCVVDEYGVFVDGAAGSDANAGTRAAPVKSIGAALGKLGNKNRVYVCEGSYPEHVKITAAVGLYGGFACASWGYSGSKPKVAPADAGFALEIADAKAEVVVADLTLVAANATDKGQSSIAAFVHDATNVLLRRTDLEAGIAKEGADGAAGGTGSITGVSGVIGDVVLNAAGYPASGTTPGPLKTCTCSSGGTSTGGTGGAPQAAGAGGGPSLGGAPSDGIGGLGSTSCTAAEPNGSGNTGADAANAADAAKVTPLGVLDASGWKPQAGADGASGTPGQGGGGGGGRDTISAGGGGACGGCGGTGGKAGAGGGASVALLSVNSTVTLRASKLTAKAAGQGGAGGARGTGASGGKAGGSLGGCGAGEGGKGGDGGTGSGGAGGISAAVLHKGPAPTIDASTLTPGTKGTKGTGGTPATNDGPDGQAAEVMAIP